MPLWKPTLIYTSGVKVAGLVPGIVVSALIEDSATKHFSRRFMLQNERELSKIVCCREWSMLYSSSDIAVDAAHFGSVVTT